MRDWIPQKTACINEARPEGAANTDEPLEHKQPDKEAVHMSRCGYNGDSAPNFNTYSEARDAIEERAAIMAEE